MVIVEVLYCLRPDVKSHTLGPLSSCNCINHHTGCRSNRSVPAEGGHFFNVDQLVKTSRYLARNYDEDRTNWSNQHPKKYIQGWFSFEVQVEWKASVGYQTKEVNIILNKEKNPPNTNQTSPPSSWDYEQVFDGGRKSCGDLILELAEFFKTIPIETRVCVIAHDEAAWIDIPAWCRLTGNGFLVEKPPFYLLQRK